MSDLLFKPVPHQEAIDFIKSKPVVSRVVFNQLLPELKARAFTITGLEGAADVMQRVRDRIAELPAGANWDDIKSDIASDISPYLVDPDADPEHRDAQINAANRRAELLLRMHGHQAYSAAQYEVMDRQRDVFPNWQYVTMEDDRVRESHAVLDQKVIPADAEFWQSHYPPWDWGCRCFVVPLSDTDTKDVEDADQGKPLEEQRVLDDDALQELESTRRLVSNGRVVDVSSPAEKGNDGAFAWHPGNLHLSLDDLKPRYDAPVWATFEKWAKTTDLDPHRTVWDWLSGSKTPGPRVPIEPAEGVQLAAARKNPVSAGIEIKVVGAQKAVIARALSAIDKVHDDGKLPKIPLTGRAGRNLGVYVHHTHSGAPDRIGIKKAGPWQHLTTAHEVGHFLDHQVLDKAGEFASERSVELERFRVKATMSDAVTAIHKTPGIPYTTKNYFSSFREIWARAYAQYIAEKSEDPILLGELEKIRGSVQPWRQWTTEDFKPIAATIDQLFKEKKWI